MDVLPHKKNKTTDPPRASLSCPKVTIQLPIFNEQFVIDRLVEAICKLEYPREKLEIQVLDDSTDETVDVARGVVERYAAHGTPDQLPSIAPTATDTRRARWRRA